MTYLLSLYAASQALLILGQFERAGDLEQKWARQLVKAGGELRIKQRAKLPRRLPATTLRSGRGEISIRRQGRFGALT